MKPASHPSQVENDLEANLRVVVGRVFAFFPDGQLNLAFFGLVKLELHISHSSSCCFALSNMFVATRKHGIAVILW